ncbi:murein transglycosylase A [Sphingomonas sp. So64.6b]|uniref:murein transglycosylase A n=1 Tax=Sphingomonas sp. So64.6b TaxID=2997354 RepID=UPI001FCEAB7F|nr:murein transglycosylase A [Sphingomonas sp. So64.6b]
MRRWGVAALALMLGACGGQMVPPSNPSSEPPVRQPVAAKPIAAAPVTASTGALTAAVAGAIAGPPIYSLPITDAQAAHALVAFRLSCPSLIKRTDTSGLTRGADWQSACAAAATARAGEARAFFNQWFESVQVGDGRAFATGYYEPEIAGSRDRRTGYDVPIYGRPGDLIEADLGQFVEDLKGKKIRGRLDRGALVPYYDRTQIETGALTGRAPIIAWAADPVEIFFLQIQGSGRLKLPDGSVMRIGYDTQNGRPYTGIGALMKERGLLKPGQTSMQGIVAWLHDNPVQGRDIMRENKSFVFFREQSGAPIGAMGLPVTGQVSAAADPKFMPMGAPVFLSLDRTDATGLWVVQDTGGAIRGSNRIDTFWGAGSEARAIAGGMSARGSAFLFLPIGTLTRLAGEAARGGAAVKP